RQMLGPLGRLTKTTQRIAEGDFSPHRAHRRFKDEFSDFTIAINRMARELQHRQKILVESQKLKSLGTLTAGVAHEINNPLNNISTSFQILSEEISDRLSEYHRGLLASVESQIIKARDIVRALLEFSRESDFVLKPADIREVVDDTLKLIKGDIPSHIRVRVNIPERIEIEVGKARLQQALLNLITNGIDAMQEEDDGLLTIQGSADRGDQVFRLEIADTGIGIPPEHIPQIFDPFFTTKEVGHGTGMGLSVTYRIIKRHGGNMSVESELGKGTKFIILLPLSRNREAGYGEENSHPHR
ncbi:MAG: ATP-binding protein, partial [Desulfobacteraceae bacterium]